jgi:hypothetical protein
MTLDEVLTKQYMDATYPMPEAAPADDFTQMATEMAGGTEPEGTKPMTLRQFGETAADVPAGLLKGAVQGTAGLPGDIESLASGVKDALPTPKPSQVSLFPVVNAVRQLSAIPGDALDRFLKGLEEETIMPTTEDVKKWLDTNVSPLVPEGADPRRVEAAKTAEFVGELGAMGELATRATKGVAQSARQIGQEIATTPPTGAVQLAPTPVQAPLEPVSLEVLIPIKIAGREIEIPAQQAATLQRAVKNLTPVEQAKFKSNTARTFVDYLQQLPSVKEFGAAAMGGRAKKGWYEGSTQAIVNVFGPDSTRFAALLSATSPQTSVESNLYNALQIWKNWTAAGRPTDRQSIVRVMGESVQGGKGEESVLDAWINNSVSALSAEDPATIRLSGPKVDSFMRNLQGNVNEVTNDAWMASFALVDQKIFGGSLTKTDPGKGPGYLAMNARVRETATYLTKLTGETWTPAEVQETIWSWAKTLYETAGAAGEERSAVQLIKDNAITDELIASTPDFRTLFYDPRFQPILEQAGYGEQLSQLRAATGGADVGPGSQKPRAGSQAAAIDPEAQRKLNERNARRLDKLRKQREQAAKEKAASENKGGN